jgi:hypothetical protein
MRHSLQKVLLSAAIAMSAILGSTLAVRPAHAFPKPSVYPIAWQLKFKHAAPKRIVVTPSGSNTPVAYWYLTYTVTNLTDTEQRFLPVFEMLTNDGTVIRSDKDVPPAVFDAIKKRERNKSLESSDKIAGRLLIGEDQAREGVAIWKEPQPRMGTFHLFAGGLSGESVYVKDGDVVEHIDWLKMPEADRKKLTTLRKTLDMTYQVPGDEIRPEEDVVNLVKEEWVMR